MKMTRLESIYTIAMIVMIIILSMVIYQVFLAAPLPLKCYTDNGQYIGNMTMIRYYGDGNSESTLTMVCNP
jgi:hypothetical protein